MIKPTIGRKVWYRPGSDDDMMNLLDRTQPCDATILFVHNDRLVNLCVFDHMGHKHVRTMAVLSQPEDETAPGTGYAEWMPFQVGQAQSQSSSST